MVVGVCWPSSGPEPQPLFDGSILDLLRESTGATHLRINLDHRRGPDECLDHVAHIRSHGFEVLPILDFDYSGPDVTGYAQFCAAMAGHFPVVELGNEPSTMHRMDPREYADVFMAGSSAVRASGPEPQVLIACEAVKAPGKRSDYFARILRDVPRDAFDGLAIHPYRNPNPPQWSAFNSRQLETQYYRSQALGKPLHVTEVGWDLKNGVTPELQAEYTYQELITWQELAAQAVYVFAFMDEQGNHDYDFGILDRQRNPRPVAAAIKRFQKERLS